MYARIITADVQADKLGEFPNKFSEELLPEISKERGFKGIYVMKDAERNQFVALVLWETEADAVASIDRYLRDRLPKMANLLAGKPESRTVEVVLRA